MKCLKFNNSIMSIKSKHSLLSLAGVSIISRLQEVLLLYVLNELGIALS